MIRCRLISYTSSSCQVNQTTQTTSNNCNGSMVRVETAGHSRTTQADCTMHWQACAGMDRHRRLPTPMGRLSHLGLVCLSVGPSSNTQPCVQAGPPQHRSQSVGAGSITLCTVVVYAPFPVKSQCAQAGFCGLSRLARSLVVASGTSATPPNALLLRVLCGVVHCIAKSAVSSVGLGSIVQA